MCTAASRTPTSDFPHTSSSTLRVLGLLSCSSRHSTPIVENPSRKAIGLAWQRRETREGLCSVPRRGPPTDVDMTLLSAPNPRHRLGRWCIPSDARRLDLNRAVGHPKVRSHGLLRTAGNFQPVLAIEQAGLGHPRDLD